jgi:hypothetical protein
MNKVIEILLLFLGLLGLVSSFMMVYLLINL